jgi:hypothetical protein
MQIQYIRNTNKTGSAILKEWTTPDSRNTPSSKNLEKEEIVDASGNDGNASMPEQVKRPNPWMMMMKIEEIHLFYYVFYASSYISKNLK